MSDGLIPWLMGQTPGQLEQKRLERLQGIFSQMQPQAGTSGGYQLALNQMAMIDPQYMPMALEAMKPMTPQQEMDMQIKQIQLRNMQGENAQAEFDRRAAERRRNAAASAFGLPTQTPNFNPSLDMPGLNGMAQERAPEIASTLPEYSALAQMAGVVPQASNIGSESVNLGLPMPTDIQSMAQQLVQARTQGAPVTPVVQEQLPPMAAAPTEIVAEPVTQEVVAEPIAQPVTAPTQSRILSMQEWAQTQPGQAALLLGEEEAIKAYRDYAKSEQDRADQIAVEMAKADRTAQNSRTTIEQAQNQFGTALTEIEKILDEMNRKGYLTSVNRGAFDNALASIGNSRGLGWGDTTIIPGGQSAESFAGTDLGRLQQRLNSAVAQLVGPYKTASGRTGGEMNSEKELEAFMKGLPGLNRSYEANKSIINQLRSLYAPNSAQAAPQTSTIATQAGNVTFRRIGD